MIMGNNQPCNVEPQSAIESIALPPSCTSIARVCAVVKLIYNVMGRYVCILHYNVLLPYTAWHFLKKLPVFVKSNNDVNIDLERRGFSEYLFTFLYSMHMYKPA